MMSLRSPHQAAGWIGTAGLCTYLVVCLLLTIQQGLNASHEVTPGNTGPLRAAVAADPFGTPHLAALAAEPPPGAEIDKRRLLAAASLMRPRDTSLQATAMAQLIADGAYADAIKRLDTLLRARPQHASALFDVAANLSTEPAARPSLLALLISEPPWRASFLRYLSTRPETARLAWAFMTDLRQSAAPPQPDELRAYVIGRIAAGDYAGGYFAWLDNLSEQQLRRAGRIYDGDFAFDPDNMGFGWTFTPMSNVQIDITARNTATADRALRVQFFNPSGRFANVSQLIRLDPGQYMLSGNVRTAQLESTVGLVWTVQCVEGSDAVIARTARLPEAAQWMPFDVSFNVPPGCATQRLRLEVNSRAALDNVIRGAVMIDSLAIVPAR